MSKNVLTSASNILCRFDFGPVGVFMLKKCTLDLFVDSVITLVHIVEQFQALVPFQPFITPKSFLSLPEGLQSEK